MNLFDRWHVVARRTGLGCEVCGRLMFAKAAFGPLCRRHVDEFFEQAMREYVAERFGIGEASDG